MSTEKVFLKPKLQGQRFEDHTLPVSILEDFSALEELIFDLARKIYLEKNPERKRVPNHFADNVYLKLSSIEEGSTIPNFLIAAVTSVISPTLPAQNDEYFQYFEAARDKVFELVESTNNGKPIDIDAKFLNYFNRIGRNLEEGETIDFLNNDNSSRNVRLNRDTRRKILLSRTETIEYSEKIAERVLVSSINKKNSSFEIEVNGDVIECELKKEFKDIIYTAFDGYEQKTLVLLKGVGIFNKNSRLIHVQDIESMDVLDPFDVSVRLDHLAKLEDGWYDGVNGKKLNDKAIKLTEEYFTTIYSDKLPLPAIFPTIEGHLLFEWKKDSKEVSLKIDLGNMLAVLSVFDMEDDNGDYEESLNLHDTASWDKLNTELKSNIG